jgi:chromate transporter
VTAVVLYFLLLKATVTSFSGITSIPVLRSDLVTSRGLISDAQLNAALAIGQSTPGPVGLYVVTVGYFADGAAGAAAGVLALATPALLVVPLLALLRRGRADLVGGAARGIVIAAAVLTLGTGAGLARTAIPNVPLAIVAVVALAAAASGRVAPLWIVIGAGLFALVVV